MSDGELLAALPGRFGDLQDAASVGRDDCLGACLENVIELALGEAPGHFRFCEIVGARCAAAEVRLGQLPQLQAGYL